MCYGDSLTWGSLPVESGIPTVRYGDCDRWTGVLADQLGDGYEVLEEGLNGRISMIRLTRGLMERATSRRQ